MTGYASDTRGLATINPRCLAHLTRGRSNSYENSLDEGRLQNGQESILSKTAHAAGASNAIIPPGFQQEAIVMFLSVMSL